ncbi:MAG: TSUP family transporter, partial [Microcystis sp. LE19-196.1B]|nr:TSUP family transporter [Microcystis sp. LE19-196.1B]
MTWLIGHLLAVCTGISLGLLGGGGSVLALPILVYVMGVPTKSAIAMTLLVIGSVSLLGTIPHWKKGNINLKTAFIFGSATMVGAFLGARLATLPLVANRSIWKVAVTRGNVANLAPKKAPTIVAEPKIKAVFKLMLPF